MNECTKGSRFTGIQIVKWICLLVTVGILCITQKLEVSASSLGELGLNAGTEGSVTTDTGSSTGTSASTSGQAVDETNNGTNFNISIDNGTGEISGALEILIILTLISLAPILLIMLTSFTRVLIVLHFTRAALNTQTAPPNQVLIGMALFLTFFIMTPTINEINENAIVPYEAGELTQEEFFDAAIEPLREFMYTQTQSSDVRMFMEISGTQWDGSLDGIPLSVLIPSFIVGELRIAFQIGFLIYIPFIVIDMVIASTLMSMGMMMLPPTTISMPFKILLFILADGWSLIIGNLVKTFY